MIGNIRIISYLGYIIILLAFCCYIFYFRRFMRRRENDFKENYDKRDLGLSPFDNAVLFAIFNLQLFAFAIFFMPLFSFAKEASTRWVMQNSRGSQYSVDIFYYMYYTGYELITGRNTAANAYIFSVFKGSARFVILAVLPGLSMIMFAFRKVMMKLFLTLIIGLSAFYAAAVYFLFNGLQATVRPGDLPRDLLSAITIIEERPVMEPALIAAVVMNVAAAGFAVFLLIKIIARRGDSDC